MHSAEVPVNIVETITGHSAGNVHGQYVHKELIAMKALQEGLEWLQYPNVLPALKVKDQNEEESVLFSGGSGGVNGCSITLFG